MSVAAPALRRGRLPLALGAVAAVALLAGFTSLLARERERPVRAAPAAPAVEQAPWRIRVRTAGAPRLPAAKRAEARSRAAAAGETVRGLYDGIFLSDERERAVRRSFSPRAGSAFLKQSDAVPAQATQVEILRRRAVVVVDEGGRHAAARVAITARARLGEGLLRLSHRSVLWLTLSDGRWRVIGFELDEEERP